jgi:hypothetical protein
MKRKGTCTYTYIHRNLQLIDRLHRYVGVTLSLLQSRYVAWKQEPFLFACTTSLNAIVVFLENTALWENRIIKAIGSVGIKGPIYLTAILLFRL